MRPILLCALMACGSPPAAPSAAPSAAPPSAAPVAELEPAAPVPCVGAETAAERPFTQETMAFLRSHRDDPARCVRPELLRTLLAPERYAEVQSPDHLALDYPEVAKVIGAWPVPSEQRSLVEAFLRFVRATHSSAYEGISDGFAQLLRHAPKPVLSGMAQVPAAERESLVKELGFGLRNVLWQAKDAPGFELETAVFGDQLEAVRAGPHASMVEEILAAAHIEPAQE